MWLRINVVGGVIFLMTLAYHLMPSIIKNKGDRILKVIGKVFKIFFVEVDFVFFVEIGTVIVSKFFTLRDG